MGKIQRRIVRAINRENGNLKGKKHGSPNDGNFADDHELRIAELDPLGHWEWTLNCDPGDFTK